MKENQEVHYTKAIFVPLIFMIIAFVAYIPVCYLTAKNSPIWFSTGLVYVFLLAILSCFVIRKNCEKHFTKESDKFKFSLIYLFMQTMYQLFVLIVGIFSVINVYSVSEYISMHKVDINVILNLTYKLSIYFYLPLVIVLSIGIIIFKAVKILLKSKKNEF